MLFSPTKNREEWHFARPFSIPKPCYLNTTHHWRSMAKKYAAENAAVNRLLRRTLKIEMPATGAASGRGAVLWRFENIHLLHNGRSKWSCRHLSEPSSTGTTATTGWALEGGSSPFNLLGKRGCCSGGTFNWIWVFLVLTWMDEDIMPLSLCQE